MKINEFTILDSTIRISRKFVTFLDEALLFENAKFR